MSGRIFGVRSPQHERASALRRTGHPATARRGVGGAVEAAAKHLQLRRGRRMRSAGRRLRRAHRNGALAYLRHRRAVQRLADLRDGGPAPGGAGWGLLPAALVVGLEVFIVLFDFGYWFNTWSRDIEPSVPWYDQQRIAVALLALTLPVLAVVGARLAGGMTRRVLTGRDERFDRVGAVAGLVLAAGAVAVIFMLAHWNFDEGGALVGVAVPPGPMATVFALIVLLDLLVRTFAVDPDHDAGRAAARRLRWWERRTDRGAERLVRAAERAAEAWCGLRSEVQVVLERVDLVTVTGDLLVLDAAGRADDREDSLTLTVPPAAPAHRDPDSAGHTGMVLPSARRQLVVAGEHHVPFGLRLVEDAIDVLDRYRPTLVGDWSAQVGELHDRLARLAALEPGGGHGRNGHPTAAVCAAIPVGE